MPGEEETMEQARKTNQIKIYTFGFLDFVKGQWNLIE